MTDNEDTIDKKEEQKVLTREEQIKANTFIIERTLESFGVYARVAEVDVLKNMVHFSFEIALGTKIDKVISLRKDLALALASPTGDVEIEAPVKGKSLIKIKVPLLTNPKLKPEKFKIIRIIEKEPAENTIRSFFRTLLKMIIFVFDWFPGKLRIIEGKI